MSAGSVVVYGATWCGHCTRLKIQLDRAGVPYEGVDVDDHPEVIALLQAVNDGAWLIPTVVVRGTVALVNPSLVQVQNALMPDCAPGAAVTETPAD